ncbi:MAG: methyltransferase domain-containing protein [Nanoarchaeota archaeon]|nr:methyltransferase domain-containing protein [Nanoarchaeota archaeon]
MKKPAKLNIGCGKKKLKGYVNIDLNPECKPDIKFDASKIKNYSIFKDESIEEIKSEHFLEHTPNAEEIMKEWHRILKKGGSVKIKLPHFSRGFTNPTHMRGFDLSWRLHFDKKNNYSTYAGIEFEAIKVRLNWAAFLDYYPCGKITKAILYIMNIVINFFANLNPNFCSRIWCFWVGGFEEVGFWFKKR